MKRELKVVKRLATQHFQLCNSSIPYEEGTESMAYDIEVAHQNG